MATTEFPININGVEYSWASILIRIPLVAAPLPGIKAIEYGSTLEPGMAEGQGAVPLGRTVGTYKAAASMTMLKAYYHQLIAELARIGGPQGQGYMEVPFDILIQFQDFGRQLISDKIHGARITDDKFSGKFGADALEVPVKLSTLFVTRNGMRPVGGVAV